MADKEEGATLKLGNVLQRNLENYKVNHPGLSTLAQKGDDEVGCGCLLDNNCI